MRKQVAMCVMAAFLGLGAVAAADPVAVLQSDAAQEQKHAALHELSVSGQVEAVPAIAALLLDPALSHMARYALEPMPYTEVGAALRDALPKAEGKLKAGIIHSLGERKDAQAFAAIAQFLNDPDDVVAKAAARSLARINPEEAVKPLLAALEMTGIAEGASLAFYDALLECANHSGDMALYGAMRQAPPQIVAGAFRGAALNRGREGLTLLVRGLQHEDGNIFNAALGAAREITEAPAADATLAELLPALAGDRRLRLTQALGERGSKDAGPALLEQAAADEPYLRVAALEALTQIGYEPAVEVLVKLSLDENADLRQAARNCLAYFPGQAGNTALREMLTSDCPETRLAAVEMVGMGGLPQPSGVLLAATFDTDEPVRIAGLRGLQDIAGMDEVAGLLRSLLEAQSPREMQAAERALHALCGRQKRMPGAVVVEKAEYGGADVTDTVAQLVESGATSVVASNATFGDTLPGSVKSLVVQFLHNGAPAVLEAAEGQTIQFQGDVAPAAVVDAFLDTLEQAQGEAKPAMLRLLGATGHAKGFEAVMAVARDGGAEAKNAALRTLCDWPNSDALPALLDLSASAADETIKVLALRGAVRLTGQSDLPAGARLDNYAALMENAPSDDAKRTVLGGLADVHTTAAFEKALRHLDNDAVRREAVQAAVTIARNLGGNARKEELVTGNDLAGWHGDMQYWRLEDGAIVGETTSSLERNQFLWSDVEAADFYMSLDLKLEPDTGNGGIQFRSTKLNEHGQAYGYQADVGKNVWARIYHESGRGKLDWTDRGEKAIVPGEWNHYEILAVGPAIWTFINGQLGAAMLDFDGERAGLFSVQLHSGPPMKVQHRFKQFVHNPKIEIENYSPETLIRELTPPQN